MSGEWTPERDAALVERLRQGDVEPWEIAALDLEVDGWTSAVALLYAHAPADLRDLRAAWLAAEARCAELYATVQAAEGRAGQLQLELDRAPWRTEIALVRDEEGRVRPASLTVACEEARGHLAAVRADATYDGDWSYDAETIGWGVLLQRATEHVDERECYECDGVGVHEDDCLEAGTDLDTVDYRLETVPGAIEAVLALATPEQLAAEVARRDSGWTPSDPYLRWTGAKPSNDATPALDPDDWRAALVAAGLRRMHLPVGFDGLEPAWVNDDDDIEIDDIGAGWVVGCTRYPTEEAAARAWLAGRAGGGA